MVKWLIFGGIALLIGGFWLVGELGQADRDASGSVVSSGDESVLALREGDCVLNLGLEGADSNVTDAAVTLVPCSEPHVYEVYSVDPSAFGALDQPNTSEFEQQGDDYCYSALSLYTGDDLDEPVFMYTYLFPTDESWRQGDRELACLLHYEDYSLWSGSARG